MPENKEVKVLCFAGSSRRDSVNKKLAQLTAKIASEFNVVSKFVDLNDFPIPLYNGDLEKEEAYPEAAAALKKIMLEHDAYIISSPEHNSSISSLLKNTFDWISRTDEAGTDLSAFNGKVAALVSAAPGNLGGLRGLVHLRSILSNLGTLVIPNQLAIPQAYEAFDEQGELKDERRSAQLRDIVQTLTDITKKSKVDLHSYCKFLFSDFAFEK